MFEKRFKSWLIDFVIYAFVIFVMGTPLLILQTKFKTENLFFLIYTFVLIIIYICALPCKDIINGQSIGKKITGLKVVCNDGTVPSKFKLIVRNITICIWPIEAILVLCSKKRIGDILCKTKLELV